MTTPLSPQTCIAIRERCDGLNLDEIDTYSWADDYGCSQTTIYNIIHNNSYLHPRFFPEGKQRDELTQFQERVKEQNPKYRQKKRQQAIRDLKLQIKGVKKSNRNAYANKRKHEEYYNEVLERDGYKCVYCNVDLKTVDFHIDHRIPINDGGSNNISNLQATCVTCNLYKNTLSPRKIPHEEIAIYISRRYLVNFIMNTAKKIKQWDEWDERTKRDFEKPFYRLCWEPGVDKYGDAKAQIKIFDAALNNDLDKTKELVVKYISKC